MPGIDPETLARAERLFNAGEFFECHEYLESAWMKAAEPAKTGLQGLIQIAAGFHKAKLGQTKGAAWLIEKGLQKIQAASGFLESAAAVASALKSPLEDLRAGRRPAAPRLRWTVSVGK